MKKTFFASAALLLLSISASAADIELKQAIIRLPPPGSTTTAMFGEIANKGTKERALLKASGPISDDFELHEMAMVGGKMSMRNVGTIALKKGAVTSLKPGGLHIMIFNLKRPLIEKEAVEITLVLDGQERIQTKAIVTKDI